MTNVIVGDPFDIAESHWQHRLSPIQGLNLALVVNAKHEGMVGRIQIETSDIAYLLGSSWS